jgi:SagB-type dehydrogenase family enzyme
MAGREAARRTRHAVVVGVLLSVVADRVMPAESDMSIPSPAPAQEISLPAPRLSGALSVEQALRTRRSVRAFADAPLTLLEVGQLLWAAQGITQAGNRTAPSAGALYPLELYVAAGRVEGLTAGVYRYLAAGHRLQRVLTRDVRVELSQAALGQDCVRDAPAVLVFAAVERRTTRKYGARGVRYVHMEVGHAAQNAFLQVTALGLAAVVIGAFDDTAVQESLALPPQESALYLLPVGRP